MDKSVLTPRQMREMEYHANFAKENASRRLSLSFEHIETPENRWWNHTWRMYEILKSFGVTGKKCLVVGCGFGADAVCLAKMGGEVSAFDLSGEELEVARQLAEKYRVVVNYRQMAAEVLDYPDHSFDLIVVVDILHHCEVSRALSEVWRVAKPGAQIVINEIYTHSLLTWVRHSRAVMWLYPRMVGWIYGTGNPYITADEQPLNNRDLRLLRESLHVYRVEYFYFLSRRLFPDRYVLFSRLDRIFLMFLKPIGSLVAGRFLMVAVK